MAGADPGRRADLLARAGLAALVLALFREPLLGGVLYERDVHLIWHPQVEGFVRAAAAGRLPLWDPSPAFGQPLLADPGAQVLYPPTWLNLLLGPGHAYTLFVVGHVLVSALAFFALVRRRGGSRLAAAAAAGSWAAGGPLVSLVTLWHHFAGASLAPVVLLMAERAAGSRRARDVVLLGAAIGLQVLAGSADMCALTLLAAGVCVLAAHGTRQPRGLLRLAAGAAAALALAGALAAGQWVASLDLLQRSSRAGLPDAMRSFWSVHPLALVEVIAAGVPGRLPLQGAAREVILDGREPFLGSLYLGLPALALVVAGLLAPGRRRLALGLAALLLGALLISLGRHAPFFDLATTLAPPLRVLRYPVKAMVAASLAWSGLVALGVDAWRGGAVPARWRLAVALTLAVSIAGVALLAGELHAASPWWVRGVVRGPAAEAVALELAVHAALGAVVFALLLAATPARASRLAGLAALILVGDLALAHRQPSPVAPAALYRHRPSLLGVLRAPGEARVYSYDYADAARARRWFGDEPPHLLARVPAGWPPPAALALGLQESLAPQTPGRWGLRQGFDADYRGLQSQTSAWLTAFVRLVEEQPGDLVRVLQVASVTHVLALHDPAAGLLPRLAESAGLFARPTAVYGVPGTLARARVVGGARIAGGTEGLWALVDPGFDPERSLVLPGVSPRESPPGFEGSARVVEEVPDAITVEAELSEAGWLVLSDTYDPGWRATVDGAPAEVLRANVAFRAVALPAGRHVVAMRYRPPLVMGALALSALTVVGLLVGVAWSLRRRVAPTAGGPTHEAGVAS